MYYVATRIRIKQVIPLVLFIFLQ